MSKAQVISGDFTVSVAIFLAILILVLPLWGYVEAQVKDNEVRRDIESSLLIASDVMIKTPGLPNDWNTSNVISIGLADNEGTINVTKAINLVNMDYNTVKELLGIIGYDVYISLKDMNGYNLTSGVCNSPIAYFSVNEEDVKSDIVNSGIVWDYYYGGSGTPETHDSRSFYNETKINAFNAMIYNRSLYNVMVIEDPELQETDINISDLQEFLNIGGIIIFEGNPTLINKSFGMHAEQGSDREGTILQKDRFVLANIGEDVTFDDADWAFYQITGDRILHTLIEDKNDNKAIVGYWEYGFGKIYYISDINATVSGSPLELNVVGEPLIFGFFPTGDMITKTQRLVLVSKDRNIVANMDMVLWK